MSKELEGRIEQLTAENRKLRDEVAVKSRTLARALASYQMRALHMDIIRQQNEELDRLAQELAKAKRLEEERSKELAAAHQIKSDFLASFSHEIRTPLNGILGYCDLLAREEGNRLTPSGQRDLGVIRSNARTLLSLINDILDLSKIEAGRVDVVRELVEVDALVDECRATAQEYLKGKNVVLNVRVARDVRRAFTDGLKLRQIMLNLMSNAAKFTHDGAVNVDVRAKDDALVLMVQDTGVGIPPDQMQHLFERFRRVNDKAHRKVGGTGLGLAIVRELSKLLGGATDVESTVGKGSKFTVTLPGAVDASTMVSSRPPPPPKSLNTLPSTAPAVLLVDDDMMIQHLVFMQLEAAGFRVEVAIDGESALRIAKDLRPAVILLDIFLPKLDGWDVLAALKSDPDLAATPVVILSGEEHRARAFSLGACDYLVKPVDPPRLIATVQRELAGGSGEILVADSNPSSRETVCRKLRQIGLSTTQAGDDEELMAKIREKIPALLIMDLTSQGPAADGFETLRRLREKGYEFPAIVLAGAAPADGSFAADVADVSDVRGAGKGDGDAGKGDAGKGDAGKGDAGAGRAAPGRGLTRVILKGELALEQVVEEAKELLLRHRVPNAAKMPRVLYVEDAPQNRDIVRRYLRGEFEVLEAEDGAQGIERALQEMPDLILMDLSLPGMDGWQATRVLKGNAEVRHIPVLALSASVGKEDHERALTAGCAEFLTKPIERTILLGAIRRHLTKRSEHA